MHSPRRWTLVNLSVMISSVTCRVSAPYKMDEVEPTPRRAMDQVISGLWVGDLSSVSANNLLEENNIKFIISAMRGRVKIGNPVGVLITLLVRN